jgi:hypothetical protein
MHQIIVKSGRRVRRFASIAAACEALGRDATKVRARIWDYGWSAEEALGLLPRERPASKRCVPVQFTHDGKEYHYQSIKHAAKANGVRASLVSGRIGQLGWTIQQALGLAPRVPQPHVGQQLTFIHANQRYHYVSVSQAARSHGLKSGAVLKRLRQGWTVQQALGLSSVPAHAKRWYAKIYVVTHQDSGRQYVGQTMVPVTARWEEHVEASRAADPGGPSLQSAISRHGADTFSVEVVATTKTFFHTNAVEREWIAKLGTKAPNGFNLTLGGSGLALGLPVKVAGKRFRSIAEAARHHGVAPIIATQRMRLNGWTAEQAVGASLPPENPTAPREVTLSIDGKSMCFPSITEAAKALGVPPGRAHARLKRSDWTPEQVFGLAPREKKYLGKSREVVFSDKGKSCRYPSLKLAAKAHGVSYGTAQARVRALGWTVPQALELVPPPRSVGKRRQVTFTYKSQTHRYPSVSEASRAQGYAQCVVDARLRYGWTWAQALGLAPQPVRGQPRRRPKRRR